MTVSANVAPATARKFALPLPNTLVVLGSSNAAGVGATGYVADPVGPAWTEPAASWVGIVRASLSGWNVFNRSISGSTTADSIARFWTDAAPHRPSVVILATALHNDGYNVQTWLQNTLRLIQMCRAIGAVPIVRGPSCFNTATTGQIDAILEAQRVLETLGVPVIDALSSLSDPANPGKFVGGASFHSGDGLHCNDAGYAHLANAVDRGLIRHATQATPRSKPQGAWALGGAVSGDQALQVTTAAGLSHALTSFTMRARIGGHASGTSSEAFMCASTLHPSDTLRVRNPASVYELYCNAAAATSAVNPISDTGVHDLVMVFRAASGLAYFYIDGALVGSAFAVATPQAVSAFVWGSREVGGLASGAANYFRFADCQLWSVPLSAEAIADMARTGYAPRAGMVFDGDMSSLPGAIGTRCRNNVPNGANAFLNLAWGAVANI